jgi:hypothetical protein
MLIKAEHGAQLRCRQCLAGASQAILVQTAEIHTLLEIDLHLAWRW